MNTGIISSLSTRAHRRVEHKKRKPKFIKVTPFAFLSFQIRSPNFMQKLYSSIFDWKAIKIC